MKRLLVLATPPPGDAQPQTIDPMAQLVARVGGTLHHDTVIVDRALAKAQQYACGWHGNELVVTFASCPAYAYHVEFADPHLHLFNPVTTSRGIEPGFDIL